MRETGIKHGGNTNREVGPRPYSVAWIIKKGFVLRTKEERWRTSERQHLNNIQQSVSFRGIKHRGTINDFKTVK